MRLLQVPEFKRGVVDMMEYLVLFSTVYSYIISSLELIIGFYFFSKFIHKKTKLYHDIAFIIIGNFMLVLFPSDGIVPFFVYGFMLLIWGIFIYKFQNISVVLYAIVTIEVMQLCFGIFNSISGILFLRLFPFQTQVMGIVFMIMGDSMSLLISIFCYHVIDKYLRYDETGKSKYMLMILIPILMIFLVDEYINSAVYGNIVVIGEDGDIRNINHYRMLIIQILGILSLFCMIYSYRKLMESFQLNTKLSLLQRETTLLHQYVDEAKDRYEKTTSFRHDIKNHITVIKGLLEHNKMEQALDYIYEMDNRRIEMSFLCHTNNPTLDILIENKLGIAKSEGIEVLCSFVLPSFCSINDIDFCIILSNALDNSLHACRKIPENRKRYIELSGYIQGDFILMEIKNSFDGKKISGMGIGLSNIKTVAEKYNGTMSYEIQDKTFVLSILLVIPQQLKDISQQRNERPTIINR